MAASAAAGSPSGDADWAGTTHDGDNGPALDSYLDFLAEGLVFGSEVMDPGTLAAVSAAAVGQPAGQRPTKRLKDESGANAPDYGSPDEQQLAGGLNDLDSDDEDELPKKGKRKASSSSASTKANREKARREKINDRFMELARLVEPGKEPKTDKLSILAEAIRFVNQTMVENMQLKQLNKFLEEKVANQEKERMAMMAGAHVLQQQYMPQQQQPQQIMVPPGMMLVPASGMAQQYMVAGPQMQPMQQAGMQQPQQQAGMQGHMQGHMQQPMQQQAPMLMLQQQPSMQLHQPPMLQRASSSAAPPDAAATSSIASHMGPSASAPDTTALTHQQQPPQQLLMQPMGSGTLDAAAGSTAASMAQGPQFMQLPQMSGKPGAAMAAMAGGMQDSVMQPLPPYFVLQPGMLDTTKDSQLRPPAA